MRLFIRILLIITPLSLSGQSWDGTYLFPSKPKKSFITEILHINKNGDFSYFYYDCQYFKLGQGKIKTTHDSLILRFEKMKSSNENLTSEFKEGNYITIKVKAIYEADSSSVTNGIAILKGLGAAGTFNSNGVVEFNSPRPTMVDTLEINQLGFFPIKIPVYPNQSSLSGIVALSNVLYLDDHDRIRYRINDKRIQLRGENNFFERISKAKAQKVINSITKGEIKFML